ncbi:MAG: BREX-1 system adenine-specific DNA-methyltransferase PglX [Ruminococcus sp.]|nr:BREX-1 system adenine-specific DNA-methyltransferase PglX [Ruminococcus sp.]
MNKNAIKNFAVSARILLIQAVTQKAFEYEVTEDGKNDPSQAAVNGQSLTSAEQSQRAQLIAQIQAKGFASTMEEAAYTWFNRFIALRFMEVNNYLPSHTRIFSDEDGNFKPEVLTDAVNLEIDGLDKELVLELLEQQQNEQLYQYIVITQCNALNEGLPEMFERIGGWTELLFPKNLLREDSVIAHMVKDIPESDWNDQVQIIGWLYQYYNSEPKEKVFANLKKNVKISAADIPAATQLFTPDWIVRYMVENSLGRLWTEGHGKPENANWKYYLEEAEQEDSVKSELENLRAAYREIQPEQIKIIDPCMGSGHILVYAFDVLMDIYTACGWSERDAAKSILRNNLYGLDIDRRAYQLAYFAVMMKARQYNRRILSAENQPNLANFADVMHVDTSLLSGSLRKFAEQFQFADTYGSLMTVTKPAGLDEAVSAFLPTFGMQAEQLEMMMRVARILTQKYDVVCTNPPYMGGSGMNATLSDFIKKNYPDYKSDLFSAFVVKCTKMAKLEGYLGFLTPYVWMFIQSYEKMRNYIYSTRTIETLIQFEYSAFEEATVPICTFVLKNSKVRKNGAYLRLTEFRGGMEVQRQKALEAISNHKCGFYYESNAENFSKIPGSPVAYWVSENFVRAFDGKKVGNYLNCRSGIMTGSDEFIKQWYEVNYNNIKFNCKTAKDMLDYKWFPLNSGGEFRKWYGNNSKIVNLQNDGAKIKATVKNFRLREKTFYFKRGITWGRITSSKIAFRDVIQGSLFGDAGPIGFIEENRNYLLGFLCSNVSLFCLQATNPTLNYQVRDIESEPLILSVGHLPLVNKKVQENIDLSKADWDSFETSWDFEGHPLV